MDFYPNLQWAAGEPETCWFAVSQENCGFVVNPENHWFAVNQQNCGLLGEPVRRKTYGVRLQVSPIQNLWFSGFEISGEAWGLDVGWERPNQDKFMCACSLSLFFLFLAPVLFTYLC